MVGRPRKKGKREPNGRIARTYVNPRKQVASQPHRMSVPKNFREREEAESEFGRLMLNRRITPAQYEAGRRYRALVSRFRAIYGLPSPDPRALDLMHTMGGYGGETPQAVVDVVRKEYDAAFCASGTAGNAAQRAVNTHAVFDKPVPDTYALNLLISGLRKLVGHFGIDPNLRISACRK